MTLYIADRPDGPWRDGWPGALGSGKGKGGK
jgi:hypothetical protein